MKLGFNVTEKEKEALGLITKMVRAMNALDRVNLGHLADVKLTVSQFGVLDVLYHLGPMCQCDVAKKILKSTGNITTVIDNLEKRGLVVRKRSTEDRRYILVHLMPDGRALFEGFFPGHMQRVEKSFSVLTAAERKEFGRLCKKLGLGQE